MKLLIPYSQSGLAGKIRENGSILSEEYNEDGVLTEALVDIRLQKLC